MFGWVKKLPGWQRPRVIFLENVEEFEEWSPLENGQRSKVRRGVTFENFIGAFRAIGYSKIEWRQRRAWISGAGTIRRRLYVIMRRDDEPIVWPEPTHGNPNVEADAQRIADGSLKPWVTAANSIDFSRPCPSIFATAAEIKKRYGLRAKRPLERATKARLAKGTFRYVLDNPKPFIVPVTHGGDTRVNDIDEPLRTGTCARRGEHALVTPFLTKFNRGATGQSAAEPMHTITAHASDTHGGGAAPLGLVAPYLVPRYQERPGQEPRTRSVEEPLPTPVPTGNEGMVAAVHLATMRNSEKPFSSPDHPTHTLTAGGANIAVIAGFFAPRYQEKPGHEPRTRPIDIPAATIVAGGNESVMGAVFLAQHNTDMVGHAVTEPVSTIVGKGSTQAVVAASMVTMRGSDMRDAPADAPLNTVSAEGNHNAINCAFLAKYYGAGEPSQSVDEPLHTDTAKPRFGVAECTGAQPPLSEAQLARAREVAQFLREHGYWDDREFVTVGPYMLIDIGMRMLTPRERFNAQGFRRDYIIDRGILEDGTIIYLTAEQQGRMCGNSVCPTESAALIGANYRPRQVMRPRSRSTKSFPLLDAAE